MYNVNDHIIPAGNTIKQAMSIIDEQGVIVNVLFVVDDANKLIGTITDGDIRRGLLKGASIDDAVRSVMQTQFKYFRPDGINHQQVNYLKSEGIFFVPVVDDDNNILEILNLQQYRAQLPVDAVIMAGGKGQRLMPLTRDTPKPLLKVGDKPIIEHNIDRLSQHGVSNINISINYLGDQLINYFGDGGSKQLNIKYIREDQPLGTIGSIALADGFAHDTILVMNSDLLTNIDYYDFYQAFKESDADLAIAATSYHVDIPYAVLETDETNRIRSLKEKPRYTYYSNAGIYFMKKDVLDHIPKNEFYNVTDLIERLIALNAKVISFPILGYWLDIGKFDDYKKAQEDIRHLNL